eukprot:scaffold358_cov256-Pinguiococcus_pyrenoidosus.AAC.30
MPPRSALRPIPLPVLRAEKRPAEDAAAFGRLSTLGADKFRFVEELRRRAQRVTLVPSLCFEA